MEIQGKIIVVAETQSGVSKATGRDWMSQEFVMEVPGQFPRKICFRLFGQERINEAHVQVGDDVQVSFDIDAREYNGRWYNTVNAFRVQHVAAAAAPMGQTASFEPPYTQSAPMQQAPAAPMQQAEPFNGTPAAGDASDLPF